MEGDVLLVALPPEDGSGAADQFLRLQPALKEGLEVKKLEDMASSMKALKDAEVDLVLMSGATWSSIDDDELEIAAVLPRQEATWVLISEDKPEYLPRKALLICPNRLLRRQMRRARSDIHTMSTEDAIERFGGPVDDSWQELVPWMESLRGKGEVDGYIIDRSRWQAAGIRARRHTLGMQHGNRDRAHFIPPAFGGIAVLVSRGGFPTNRLKLLDDKPSRSALEIESSLLSQIPGSIRDIVAINVQQRGVGTILREADDNDDLAIKESLLDTYGRVIRGGTRIEIRMETMNNNGRRTIAVERTGPLEFAYEESVNTIREWNELLAVALEKRTSKDDLEVVEQFLSSY